MCIVWCFSSKGGWAVKARLALSVIVQPIFDPGLAQYRSVE